MHAAREAACVRGRIVEDADQRLVTLRQRPGRAEGRALEVLVGPAVLARDAAARFRRAEAHSALARPARAFKRAEADAPGLRVLGIKRHQLAHAFAAHAFGVVQQRARVGFRDRAGLNEEEPPHHRLGAAEPRRHQRMRRARERVPRRNRCGIAEEHVERAEERLRDAP